MYVIIVSMLLPGCVTSMNPVAPTASSKQTSVTLTLMANQDWINKPYLQKSWELYQMKTGNHIELQSVPIDTAATLIDKRVAMGEIADIVMYFGGISLNKLHPDANFVDMSHEFWVSDIKESALPQITFNGKIYGLPLWEASVGGILYNKELFNKWNIPVPSNQTEFFHVCDALQSHGITPVYLASKDIWPLSPWYGVDPLVSQYPDLVHKLNTNQVAFADLKEFRELVDWYKYMNEKGYFGKNMLNNNWDGQASALHDGKYAMAIAWDSYLYTDLEVSFPGAAEKFGIMPHFIGGSGIKAFEGSNPAMMLVNKNSKHVKEAIEFIRFLAKPENLNASFKDFQTQTFFESVTSNKQTLQYTEASDTIRKFLYPSISPFIVGFAQTEISKVILQAMIGTLTTDEALREMDNIRIKEAKAQNLPGF